MAVVIEVEGTVVDEVVGDEEEKGASKAGARSL